MYLSLIHDTSLTVTPSPMQSYLVYLRLYLTTTTTVSCKAKSSRGVSWWQWFAIKYSWLHLSSIVKSTLTIHNCCTLIIHWSILADVLSRYAVRLLFIYIYIYIYLKISENIRNKSYENDKLWVYAVYQLHSIQRMRACLDVQIWLLLPY